ncbi:MAG TPA: methyl-accepting chemotaxis protein [bacterium]|nr:methyl-accepting chemotaxis protein [bacterium]
MKEEKVFAQLRLRLVGAVVMASAAQVAIIIVMLGLSSTLGLPHLIKALPAMAILTLVVIGANWLSAGRWLGSFNDYYLGLGGKRPATEINARARQAQEDLILVPGKLARHSVALWLICGLFLFLWLSFLPLIAVFYQWEAFLVLVLSALSSLIGYVFIYYSAKQSIRELAADVLSRETGFHIEKQKEPVAGLRAKLQLSFLSLTVAGTLILLTLFLYQGAAGVHTEKLALLTDLRNEWDIRIKNPSSDLGSETLLSRSSRIFKITYFVVTAEGRIIFPAEGRGVPNFSVEYFQKEVRREQGGDYDAPLSVRVDSEQELMLLHAAAPPGVNSPVYVGQAFSWSGLGGWKSKSFLVCALFVVLIILLTWRVVSLSAEDVLRPVSSLLEETRRVGRGELDVSFNIVSEDEIGALAAGMKVMVTSLRATVTRLRSAYQGVEGVISELKGGSQIVAEGSTLQRREAEDTDRGLSDMSRLTGDVSQQASELSGAITDGVRRIQEMMKLVHETSASMDELDQSVETSSSSILEMAAAVKQVAFNADELLVRSEETSSSMVELEASIREVESSAKENQTIAEQVRGHAHSGVEAVQATIQGIGEIEESVRRAMDMINQLGGSTKKIGKILSVIRDVTNQTNMLALNAAIIASQAGEHGKGFAVVADEIKSLADRASESTKEIDDIIQQVRADTRRAVETMKEGYQNVESGVNRSFLAGEALEKIEKSVEQSFAMVDKITRVTIEQVRNTRRAIKSTETITELIHQIANSTNEQAKGSDLILKSSNQIQEITAAVHSRAEGQSGAAQQVQQLMAGLDRLTGLLTKSQAAEQEAEKRIAAAMSRIKDIAASNEKSVARLDNNIALLTEQAEIMESILNQFKTD